LIVHRDQSFGHTSDEDLTILRAKHAPAVAVKGRKASYASRGGLNPPLIVAQDLLHMSEMPFRQ
jgi:hypothetical protein